MGRLKTTKDSRIRNESQKERNRRSYNKRKEEVKSEQVEIDIKRIGSKFEDYLSSINWQSCENCNSSFPDLNVKGHLCSRCLKDPIKFTSENYMDPGEQPYELKCLTLAEQQLISLVLPIVSLYKIRGNQYGYSGHVICFDQEIQNIATVLPRLVSDLTETIIIERTFKNRITALDINVNRIHCALIFLKENNPLYKDIIISDERLTQIKDIDNITEKMARFDMGIDENQEITERQATQIHESVIGEIERPNPKDCIYKVR